MDRRLRELERRIQQGDIDALVASGREKVRAGNFAEALFDIYDVLINESEKFRNLSTVEWDNSIFQEYHDLCDRILGEDRPYVVFPITYEFSTFDVGKDEYTLLTKKRIVGFDPVSSHANSFTDHNYEHFYPHHFTHEDPQYSLLQFPFSDPEARVCSTADTVQFLVHALKIENVVLPMHLQEHLMELDLTPPFDEPKTYGDLVWDWNSRIDTTGSYQEGATYVDCRDVRGINRILHAPKQSESGGISLPIGFGAQTHGFDLRVEPVPFTSKDLETVMIIQPEVISAITGLHPRNVNSLLDLNKYVRTDFLTPKYRGIIGELSWPRDAQICLQRRSRNLPFELSIGIVDRYRSYARGMRVLAELD